MVGLAVLLAVVAGVRGVWSPCGLSMLSTITPMGERGRGHRYGSTATWYVAGALVGGLSVGLVLAPLAWVSAPALAVVASCALVAFVSDSRVFGFRLPYHRRQVNERWLDRYRPWVYGAGFGWQVGTGFATYIMTAANYLLVVVAVASGSPVVAVAVWSVFGLVRGIAVLLTRSARTPAALQSLHRRVHAAGPAVVGLVLSVEAMVGIAAAWAVAPVLGVIVGAACAAVAIGPGRMAPTVCAVDATTATAG